MEYQFDQLHNTMHAPCRQTGTCQHEDEAHRVDEALRESNYFLDCVKLEVTSAMLELAVAGSVSLKDSLISTMRRTFVTAFMMGMEFQKQVGQVDSLERLFSLECPKSKPKRKAKNDGNQ